MTDRGEGELRKWALERNGDPQSNKDIVQLIFAFADDFDAAHADTLAFFKESRDDREAITARITLLEEWRVKSETSCQERVLKLIEKEHDERHGAHMEKDHPIDASFQQRFVWWWGGKLSYLVLALIVVAFTVLLNRLFN